MSDYEGCKLQLFVDIVSADGIPGPELLAEVAEIIDRWVLMPSEIKDGR